jgi:hypothetical protein
MPIDASPAGTLDIENATLRSREIVALTNMVAGNDVVRSGGPALEVYGDPSHGGNEARLELVSNTANTISTSFTRLTSNAGVLSVKSGTDASDNGTITFGGFQNERLRITSDGKVGVGTASPDYKLHIEDATNPRILLENTDPTLSENQDIGSILFKQNDTTNAGTGIIGKIRMSSVIGPYSSQFFGTSANMIFSVGNNPTDNANIDALTIRGDGNVGIGTTNPGSLLNFYKDYPVPSFNTEPALDYTQGIIFSSDLKSYSSSGIAWNNGDGVIDTARIWFQPTSYSSVSSPSAGVHGKLNFGVGYNNSGGTTDARTPFMTMTTDFKLGIGTNDPYSTIDVVSTGGNTRAGGIGHRNSAAVWDHIYMTCDGSYGFLLAGGASRLHLGVANENTSSDYYGNQDYNGVLINDGATSISAWSDIRIKTQIEALSDVIDSIAKLDTIKYNLKRDYAYNKKLIGLVSQNVRKYFPDLVTESKDGDISVDYGELPVILLRAIQELQSDINRSSRVILEGIEEDPVGLLVSKNGDKCINTYNKVVSIPKVSLSNVYQDKRCVGVISSMETVEDKDTHYEEFDIISEKDTNDNFTFVKSIGKGKIWVTDMNGHFEIGEYITTSNISGYGTRQSDDILHSYTVGKITVDCDFLESYNTIEQPIKVTREVDHWVKENWVESSENEHCRLDECDCRVIDSIYYTDGTSNISVDEYSNLESNVQSTYTEQVRPVYQRKRFKESTIDPENSGYVKTKITRTFNAIDENGKLLWETSDQKKPMYPIRYLDLDGNVTDEANAVYKAALVDCNFVST